MPPESDEDEEELLCWSGPPKPKRAPIKCNEQIFFTEPVFRQPRRFSQASTTIKSTLSKDSGPEESNLQGEGETDSNVTGTGRSEGHTDNGSSNRKSRQNNVTVQIGKTSVKMPLRKQFSEQGNISREQAIGCPDGNEKIANKTSRSKGMPPKDPLCHKPIVTPPCPISTMAVQTPTEMRLYTHVSYLPLLFSDAYVFLLNVCFILQIKTDYCPKIIYTDCVTNNKKCRHQSFQHL